MTTRRDFLRTSLAGGLAMGSMAPFSASAQSSGYKALVFVLLKGGMDAHDTLIPTNANAYSTWTSARQSLIGDGVGTSRDLSGLRPLGTAGSPEFGLPPELATLGELYDDGDLAIMANTGPLEEFATRQQVLDGTVRTPPRLASHNDQRSIWQTGLPEGGTVGWGGRFMDSLGSFDALSRINVGEPHPWVSSEDAPGLRLAGYGLNYPTGVGRDGVPTEPVEMAMLRHYRHEGRSFNNVFMQDVARAQRDAYDAADTLIDVLADTTMRERFTHPTERLSRHMTTVAKIIQARNTFGINRQIFFVSMKGFDVHGGQMAGTPALYGEVSRGLTQFYAVMKELGLQNDVTTFTVTDFGRTLQSNPSGTDHGWGGHQFVIGGAVNGGKVYGEMPLSEFGHDQDWRRGALIPTTSVEQYAEQLGRWFGVSESGLDSALPNRGRFGSLSESFI